MPATAARRSTPEFKAQRREIDRRYRANNPGRIKAKRDRWRAAHPERGRLYSAAYHEAHRLELLEKRRKHRLEHPEVGAAHARRYRLARKFGLSLADYEALLEAQGGLCAICRCPCPTGKRLAVDYDHETGAVRGLLCAACNRGIGMFSDDPDRLRAALTYLETAQGGQPQ